MVGEDGEIGAEMDDCGNEDSVDVARGGYLHQSCLQQWVLLELQIVDIMVTCP